MYFLCFVLPDTSKQINDEHVEDGDPEFLTQKAYLIALQQRTAQEKEEIAKLLQQRDELAGRLASLKAGNLLVNKIERSLLM